MRGAMLLLTAASLAIACRHAAAPPSAAGDDVRIARLSKECDDADANVRDAAARALTAMHDPRAYDALVGAALRNWNVGGQEGPGWKWLEAAGPDALPAMARVFPSQGWWERLALLDFVGREHLVGGEPLVRLGLADSDSDVVDNAVYVIGAIPLPNAFERLSGFLRDARPHRRDSAIAGLAVLGDPRGVRPLVGILVAPNETPFATHDYDNARQPSTLHDAASTAIDKLAGQSFHGDVSRIRNWLAQHPTL